MPDSYAMIAPGHTAKPIVIPTIKLKPGLVISRSVKIVPGIYNLPGSNDKAAITIKGDNITVDANGAILRGSSITVNPDQRTGLGITIQGHHITIRNLMVNGYKTAVIARDTDDLQIKSCDFSYNWKPRLGSTIESEDENDWLDYHNNEKDEWLRYGGGIYLKNCHQFLVEACRITGGQDGLKMVGCTDGVLCDNAFSFLSGVGVGMYRSSRNIIRDNWLDYCVRGYSHGVYNRGQDSASILVYEQSNQNLFLRNSATHGGDGFFLWAGQSTMDTGKGGCNQNVVQGNDFSYSPCNGIEATFSQNWFYDNKLVGCWHGVWGGYSFDSTWAGNLITKNQAGISIEHGQNNVIAQNLFAGNDTDIQLWMNATQDPNWGYPKHHDTVSHGYVIVGNKFSNEKGGMDIKATKDVNIRLHGLDKPMDFVKGDSGPEIGVETNLSTILPGHPVPGAAFKAHSALAAADRSAIIVDEWGPYDYRTPKLWPVTPAEASDQRRFKIIGPGGSYKLRAIEGAKWLSPTEGQVPSDVVLQVSGGQARSVAAILEFHGGDTFDVRGIKTPAGTPVVFGYRTFYAPIDWTVSWFTWDPKSDPRTNPTGYDEQAKHPERVDNVHALDYAGYRFGTKQRDHFGARAEGSADFPAGMYNIGVVADDGIRVWVDDKVVIDGWKYQGPTPYSAKVKLGGRHSFRVEYFQINGYAALKFKVTKA